MLYQLILSQTICLHVFALLAAMSYNLPSPSDRYCARLSPPSYVSFSKCYITSTPSILHVFRYPPCFSHRHLLRRTKGTVKRKHVKKHSAKANISSPYSVLKYYSRSHHQQLPTLAVLPLLVLYTVYQVSVVTYCRMQHGLPTYVHSNSQCIPNTSRVHTPYSVQASETSVATDLDPCSRVSTTWLGISPHSGPANFKLRLPHSSCSCSCSSNILPLLQSGQMRLLITYSCPYHYPLTIMPNNQISQAPA